MPVYNVEAYIREALDSVLKQKDINIECICIDDGSKDKSGEILDNYANTDSKLQSHFGDLQ